jgi:hypothetical protein
MAREVPTLFVGRSEPRPAPVEEPPAPSRPPPPKPELAPREPAPAPDEGGFTSRVSTAWWIVAGAGVVVAGSGVVALVLAKGKQDEVDQAPTATPEDFDRLVELEDEGEQLTRIGNGLLIGGGAALALGGAFILYQGLSDGGDQARPSASLSPMPVTAGLGLSLRVPLP